MASMSITTGALRYGLLGVLTAVALGGATALSGSAPSVTGANDPCAASEMARTVGSVAKSAGDYLDSHPETNQAMTSAVQQPAGPASVNSLKGYFDANPKVTSDFQKIGEPLAGLSTKCKLPISLPQVLGFMQNAQGGLPEGLPGGLPGGGFPAQPVAGAPAPGPAAGPAAGGGSAAAAPAPNPAAPPLSAIR
jgi:hemophore